jgi:hypothetical protein
MQDHLQTVLSQYQNSPVILALLDAFNSSIDPSVDIDNWYRQVWNIKTAEGYGLDVWGRIVGVSRYVNMTYSKRLGFATGFYPFGEAPWYDNNSATNNLRLDDGGFRTLILLKAFVNIMRCSVPMLNQLLLMMFPGQRCYVLDTGNMTFVYHFEFTPTPVQIAIMTGSGVMPHPAGVSASFVFP